MPSVRFSPQLSDPKRRLAIYSGDILILPPTSATAALVVLARAGLLSAAGAASYEALKPCEHA